MIRFISIFTNFLWSHIVSKFQNPTGIVDVGEYTYGSPRILSFLNTDKIIIGKFCSIADYVTIVASGEHRLDRLSTFPLKSTFIKKEMDSSSKGPIIIGNDVWIGTGAIILSNVKIGDGAVVGAGSVVTGSVPPYAIVTGVPAKVSKFRFTQDQIKKLLEIAWWNWSIEKILANIDYFYGDVDDFITRFSQK